MSEQIKLSTAIREGAKLRPQAFGASFVEIDGRICSCAWGAANEAITGTTYIDRFSGSVLWKTHKIEASRIIKNPVTQKESVVATVITDLNDYNKWTREQIADWLEKEGY